MAGLEDLLGLLSVGAPQKAAIQASDPYLQFKQAPDAISQLLINPQVSANPNFSLKDKIVAGLITGGLSGIMGGLSNDYENRATNAYSEVLNSFKQGLTPEQPPVLEPGLFNMARDQATVFKIGQRLKQEDDINQLINAGLKKKIETIQEIEGKNQAYGLKGLENPDSPEYKIKQDQFKADHDQAGLERQLANDFSSRAADFKYKEQGLKALTEAYLDPAGTSDYELIRRGAQAVEPGLAVRLDDEASLKGAASIFGMTSESIKAAITGESKLSPDVRAGIMRIAKRSYNASLDDYNTIRDSYIKRAEKSKLDPTLVVPFQAGKSFEQLYPNLNIGGSAVEKTDNTTPTTAPNVGNDLSRYRPDQIEFFKMKGWL